MLSMGGQTDIEIDEEELEDEEMDESVREFNFWTHQIHIFFMRKLFPAFEHMERIKEKKLEIRAEKMTAALEAQKLREEEERKEAALEAKLSDESATKERSVTELSEITKDGEAETVIGSLSEAKS
ncbi:uncharacterized protein LOC100375134 [Saccoglossus kowalevskii]